MSNAAPFTISRVSVGLGNRDRWGETALAEATVTVGPFKFWAYVSPKGAVDLPLTLRDDALRYQITAALRTAAAAALEESWARLTAAEGVRFLRDRVSTERHEGAPR